MCEIPVYIKNISKSCFCSSLKMFCAAECSQRSRLQGSYHSWSPTLCMVNVRAVTGSRGTLQVTSAYTGCSNTCSD